MRGIGERPLHFQFFTPSDLDVTGCDFTEEPVLLPPFLCTEHLLQPRQVICFSELNSWLWWHSTILSAYHQIRVPLQLFEQPLPFVSIYHSYVHVPAKSEGNEATEQYPQPLDRLDVSMESRERSPQSPNSPSDQESDTPSCQLLSSPVHQVRKRKRLEESSSDSDIIDLTQD